MERVDYGLAVSPLWLFGVVSTASRFLKKLSRNGTRVGLEEKSGDDPGVTAFQTSEALGKKIARAIARQFGGACPNRQ